ncbi:MAG: hypothetical protein ACI9G9_000581 [Psychromonas sp.]|jgi:hypothetical protein
MKKLIVAFALLSSISYSQTVQRSALALSLQFFEAVRMNSPKASGYAVELARLDAKLLDKELDNDDKILAFWMNIYNSNIQYVLRKDSTLYQDRGAFFKAKQFTVAGELLSFDIVEHGILRKSKSKLSLGYFRKLRVSKFERKLRIGRLDPRIHYALNCGALSCPPVVAYHADKVDQEMEKSVMTYLEKNVKVEEKVIMVPVLFSWFRADFGGKRGVKKFLLKRELITTEDKEKELKFLDYDWTLDLDPYL